MNFPGISLVTLSRLPIFTPGPKFSTCDKWRDGLGDKWGKRDKCRQKEAVTR